MSSIDDEIRKLVTDAKMRVKEQVFKMSVLLQELRRRRRVKYLPGGEHIVIPTADGYMPWAKYEWRRFSLKDAISWQEYMEKDLPSVPGWYETFVKNRAFWIGENLHVMLFGVEKGNDGKAWLGLKALVDDTSPLGGTDSELVLGGGRELCDEQSSGARGAYEQDNLGKLIGNWNR